MCDHNKSDTVGLEKFHREMAYSHCTRRGLGPVEGMEPGTIE